MSRESFFRPQIIYTPLVYSVLYKNESQPGIISKYFALKRI